MKALLCCAAILVFSASAVLGDECCDPCAACGCHDNCCKVCRVICEVKKVPKPEYDCECEDYCIPGKSIRSIECDECGHRKIVYTPTCGTVRTRKKLVTKQKMVDKVVYKWEVVNLCAPCAKQKEPPKVAVGAEGEVTPETRDLVRQMLGGEPSAQERVAAQPSRRSGAERLRNAEAIQPVGFEAVEEEAALEPVAAEPTPSEASTPAPSKFDVRKVFKPIFGK
jgi:hypothetical protein